MKPLEIEKMAKMEEEYWWHQGKKHLIKSLIERYLPKTKHLEILEIGCGAGGLTKTLTQFGNVMGFDISQDAVDFCKQKGLKNIFVQDINELDPADYKNRFDLVLALDVLEHIQDDVSAMNKIREMLKPEGLFFINVPAHKFLWSEHDEALEHKRRYHSLELTKKLSDSGFDVLSKSYFVSLISPIIILYRAWGNIFGKSAYPKTSYVILPSILNKLLFLMLKLEIKLLMKTKLRFGVTLNVVARPKRIS